MSRALAAVLVVVGSLGAAVAPARADDDRPVVQKMRFVERGDQLEVTTTISKLFDTAAYEALDSGFTSTVVIRIWIYPRDSNEPIAGSQLARQVLYNLWDEVYELKLQGGDSRRVVKEKRKAEAFKRLTELVDLPVAKLSQVPYDQVFLLGMEIELNPVDPKTLTEVRRWLSQGTGGGLDRGGAFFGSFVSVFVNPKIAEADRVLRLRSQPFYRPRPATP